MNLQCVELSPKWAKGYARVGAALHGSRRFDEAVAAYEKGIAIEDSPALRKGLKEVNDAKGVPFFLYDALYNVAHTVGIFRGRGG